jgi:hypothetical protein
MPSPIWDIKFSGNKGSNSYATPPDLVPTSKNNAGLSPNFLKTAYRSPYKIDVVNNFWWTYSNPKTSEGQLQRAEVPRIELNEKKIEVNAIVNQALYFTGTGIQKLQDGASAVANALEGIDNPVFKEAGQKAAGAFNSGKNALNSIKNTVNKITNTEQYYGQLTGVLAPYDGLYFSKPTGWTYNLPYFDNTLNDVGNAFGESSQAVGQLFQSYTQGIEEAITLANTLMGKPGTYIEKTKFFQFPDQGDPITFSFPLINTGSVTFDDVVKNWQLVYLLTYQNRPSRISRDLIEPSVIYEVNIPGIKYTPYAYMSKLNIQFIGSRRSIAIPLNVNSGSGTSPVEIDTIVPDAYQVTITLQSLVAETKNFMYSSLTNKNSIVNVTYGNAGVGGNLFNTLGTVAQNIYKATGNVGTAVSRFLGGA